MSDRDQVLAICASLPPYPPRIRPERPPHPKLIESADATVAAVRAFGVALGIEFNVAYEIVWLQNKHMVAFSLDGKIASFVGCLLFRAADDPPYNDGKAMAYSLARFIFQRSIRQDNVPGDPRSLMERTRDSLPFWHGTPPGESS